MSVKVEEALRALSEAVRLDGGRLLEVVVDRPGWYGLANGMRPQDGAWLKPMVAVPQEPDRGGALVATLTFTGGGDVLRIVGVGR